MRGCRDCGDSRRWDEMCPRCVEARLKPIAKRKGWVWPPRAELEYEIRKAQAANRGRSVERSSRSERFSRYLRLSIFVVSALVFLAAVVLVVWAAALEIRESGVLGWSEPVPEGDVPVVDSGAVHDDRIVRDWNATKIVVFESVPSRFADERELNISEYVERQGYSIYQAHLRPYDYNNSELYNSSVVTSCEVYSVSPPNWSVPRCVPYRCYDYRGRTYVTYKSVQGCQP